MILRAIELRARAAARRAGFTAMGAIFCLIGLVFLNIAAWIYLSEVRDALFAALVLGGIWFGLGLIFFALGARRTIPVPVDAPAVGVGATGPTMRTYATAALIEAFMVGLSAGVANRRRRD